MMKNCILPFLIGVGITVTALPAVAEILTIAGPNAKSLIPEGPVSLQCWQWGQKIIEERGLYDMSATLPANFTAAFSRPPQRKRAITVTSVGDMTCLIKLEN
jgi:hypothetical protein